MTAPDPHQSVGEVKNNNQLETGASKVGNGCQDSVEDHMTMAAGNNK